MVKLTLRELEEKANQRSLDEAKCLNYHLSRSNMLSVFQCKPCGIVGDLHLCQQCARYCHRDHHASPADPSGKSSGQCNCEHREDGSKASCLSRELTDKIAEQGYMENFLPFPLDIIYEILSLKPISGKDLAHLSMTSVSGYAAMRMSPRAENLWKFAFYRDFPARRVEGPDRMIVKKFYQKVQKRCRASDTWFDKYAWRADKWKCQYCHHIYSASESIGCSKSPKTAEQKANEAYAMAQPHIKLSQLVQFGTNKPLGRHRPLTNAPFV
eukprot:TRINITY_DN4290_c0_g1_i1.p1 TRINITY_DN4290_c0_g1~~TRINITY_DN4290_c0_g1_i1.p1  ORF type:complete len:269 (-),score=34.73 TRINITY_DN4290_c0_g1_i1:18-824(-)